MELSSKHIRLLKKISKTYVTRTNKYNTEDIEYLRSLGLVSVTICDKPNDFYYHPRITEKGKAILYMTKNVAVKANFAIVLSILALAISFLVAFTPFADWSRAFIEGLFCI